MIKFPPVPFTAANLTNTELARHIRHHYPQMTGPLAVMLERFENRSSQETDAPIDPAGHHKCPHCGTGFEVGED